MIPLGIMAVAGRPLGAYELITSTVVSGSSTSTITFDVTGLGSTYKHLQIRSVGRTAQALSDAIQWIRFNGDTASNYSYHWLTGNGTTVSSNSGVSQTLIRAGTDVGSTSGANIFGANIIDILDPFTGSKYTTTRSLSGAVGSTSQIFLLSGSWRSTATVTSISVIVNNLNFVAGSRFSLYGIRG